MKVRKPRLVNVTLNTGEIILKPENEEIRHAITQDYKP